MLSKTTARGKGNDAVGTSLRALINSIAWVIGMNWGFLCKFTQKCVLRRPFRIK